MQRNLSLRACILAVSTATALGVVPGLASEPLGKRPYSVIDDTRVTLFGDLNTGLVAPISLSPDGRFAVVVASRGRLSTGGTETEVRVYSLSKMEKVLEGESSEPSRAEWSFSISSVKEGPAVQGVRWLADSSAFAFLQEARPGSLQLRLAVLKSKSLLRLTPEGETVEKFDIRNASDYVYVTSKKQPMKRSFLYDTKTNGQWGDNLYKLAFPPEKYPDLPGYTPVSYSVWAVMGGHRKRVTDKSSSRALNSMGEFEVKLSPDGTKAVVFGIADKVPQQWVATLPAAGGGYLAVTAGSSPRDEVSNPDLFTLGQFNLVNMNDGRAEPLLPLPSGWSGGWMTAINLGPAWSNDGKSVLIGDSFVQIGGHSEACVTVVRLLPRSQTCALSLEEVKRRGEIVHGGGFWDDDKGRHLLLQLIRETSGGKNGWVQLSESDKGWVESAGEQPVPAKAKVTLEIRQSANERPTLWATDRERNRSVEIWDPNSWLDQVNIGHVEVLHFGDGEKSWEAGLFYPPDFEAGKKYPVVIQTHGFQSDQFRPSGLWPGAYAAQALASQGFLVLQVPTCHVHDQSEADCNVGYFEAAIANLIGRNLIDETRIGIIGFSRTCYYVMHALVKKSVPIASAIIQDGITVDFDTYVRHTGIAEGSLQRGFDNVIGARPFGEGLKKQWVERSPLFNTDKIEAPLLSIAPAPGPDMLAMWDPYALLRIQNKPSDLLVLNSREHIPTNPRTIVVSEQVKIDWFRFWLQGYEDGDPKKATQYRRWETLCNKQIEIRAGLPTPCVPSKH